MHRARLAIWTTLVSCFVAATLATAAGAVTASYVLSSSGGTGILAGNAVACPSVGTCLAGTPDFSNASLELASGTLDVVDSATPGFPAGTVSLLVPSITLTGGPLGGADEIQLTGLSATFSYAAFGLLESALGGGLVSLTGLVPPTATLTGTAEFLLGGASVSGPSAFSTTATLSALGCIVAPGQCGTQLDFSYAGLEYRVTANLGAVVPEPTVGLMIALGLLTVTRSRNRR